MHAGAAVPHGEARDGACLAWVVAHGWACRSRFLTDGRQQIFNIVLPGDTIGVVGGPFDCGGTDAFALTDLLLMNARKLKQLVLDRESPHQALRSALANDRRLEERRLLDQVVRLGRLNSHERVPHLLLEICEHLQSAGLANGTTFPFPLTQSQLGDVLGLSLVHINRTLQRLRQENLLSLKPGSALHDLHGLRSLAQGSVRARFNSRRMAGENH